MITHFQQGTGDQGGGFTISGVTLGGGRSKTEVRATIQMIDATTGAIVASKNFTGIAQNRKITIGIRQGGVGAGEGDNIPKALDQAISEIIPWMVTQLPSVPWRGSVVKVAGDNVIINRGTREGVSPGDEFIAGESEILSYPDTGETLDEIVHERARIRVIKAGERTSTCSVTQGDLYQIVEGMGIQPQG